jgi:hypothetical protein
MSHYEHNVCCRISTEIQLLVASVAKEEKITVYSFGFESRGVRVEKRQEN